MVENIWSPSRTATGRHWRRLRSVLCLEKPCFPPFRSRAEPFPAAGRSEVPADREGLLTVDSSVVDVGVDVPKAAVEAQVDSPPEVQVVAKTRMDGEAGLGLVDLELGRPSIFRLKLPNPGPP